jgi:hypothetical protein
VYAYINGQVVLAKFELVIIRSTRIEYTSYFCFVKSTDDLPSSHLLGILRHIASWRIPFWQAHSFCFTRATVPVPFWDCCESGLEAMQVVPGIATVTEKHLVLSIATVAHLARDVVDLFIFLVLALRVSATVSGETK